MIRKRGIVKKIFFSQVTMAIVGLFIVISISVPLAKNISKQYKINSEINELEDEIEDLEGKNTDLKKLIGYLETDQFIDEQARKNLNFKKEGEDVAVIKSESLDVSGQEGGLLYKISGLNKAENTKPEGNPKKWLNYFFSHKS